MGMNRRDFNRAILAATGGIIAGATFGCGDKKDTESSDATESSTSKSSSGTDKKMADMGSSGKHVCKSLNTCKGKGGCKTGDAGCAGKNTCKGKGGCATVKAHACAGKNDCKGQGGCGSTKGKNDCKGKGGCSVPLKH